MNTEALKGSVFPEETHDKTLNLEQLLETKYKDFRTSVMSKKLVESEILRISWEIKELVSKGQDICDLTLGDFNPKDFPIPQMLQMEIKKALEQGNTNYPPADGIKELKKAVQQYVEHEYNVRYPLESILIYGGARPALYTAYRVLLDPGDIALYSLPSWNNNHYMTLSDGRPVEIETKSENNFFPTIDDIRPFLSKARVIELSSPLNPTGTLISSENLKSICEAIVAENRRRQELNAGIKKENKGGMKEGIVEKEEKEINEVKEGKELFLVYDQVYAGLVSPSGIHAFPTALCPEVAKYTLVIDGISKSFAATGLRVGWTLGPCDVINRMKAVLGHIGAWAPRPEQVATAAFLTAHDEIRKYRVFITGELEKRLFFLHNTMQNLKKKGLPVDSIEPKGSIYLSLRFDIRGRKRKNGKTLEDAEDMRAFLLEEAGLGLVPFYAFGCFNHPTWFRASVGGISLASLEKVPERLEKALATLI
ncbi:MAG: aminotransferase class I/II-fold pyridoxal phosphate-dependent enzyme [Thermoplasmata archaeon]